MRTVFTTFVSDDWYLPCGCQKLERSAKYFHPEIPFITFKSDAIKGMHFSSLQAAIVSPFLISANLANDYDLIVYFDADQIIVDRLDEVLIGDYEVAGVRNSHDFGGTRNDPATIYDNMDTYKVLNCGLVASTNKDFWLDWHNSVCRYGSYGGTPDQVDQYIFNTIFYSGKYKTKLLDPVESKIYYGLSSAVGRRKPFESWLEIQVKDDGLYLWGKKIKVLHHAGIGEPERFQPDLFNKETLDYLENVTGTKFI